LNALTYVIASRNDDWASWNHDLTGTPVRRLYNTLQSIERHHPEAEVIVVDWGSENPLCSDIRKYAAAKGHCPCARFIYVPPALTNQFLTPFCEVVALNIGIRRARHDWIARLDQDTLVGRAFPQWFHLNIPRSAFFSLRRDLAPGDIVPRGDEQVWRGWPLDCKYFINGAVGLLLAPRDAWFHVHAYNQSLIHRNHMEHDLCFRFLYHCGFYNLGTAVDACFYHQWHPQMPDRPDNAPVDICMGDKIPIPNDENWGFAGAAFQEHVLST
jgi:hypothetical protein